MYKSYVDSLDAQLDIVEKSGMFSEIGKSFTGGYSSLAKSEPESKIEAIAKATWIRTLPWTTQAQLPRLGKTILTLWQHTRMNLEDKRKEI